ncbi:hypothetical protein SCLCIDRAFT_1215971 [Scleroderma citrinum Foug A]|uniref:Hydrophobin n=1 Tax=Scleroderma citrinum Foug A TaxID=1036808 RepID=A0A0C3DZ61_9AGAM|nr:hypothetical protein SCLCIDRAFT_1215971 [Scleroderma citrinum Foug A]
MFFRASALLLPVVALSSLVAAAPEPVARGGGASCSNGTAQCCNSTYENNATNTNLLEGLLGIVLDVTAQGLLGLDCSPITVIGLGGGASCTQQAVCCQGTDFTGLVNIGCTNLNL